MYNADSSTAAQMVCVAPSKGKFMKIIETIEGTVVSLWDGGARIKTPKGQVYVRPGLAKFSDLCLGATVSLESETASDPQARSPFVAREIFTVTPPQQPTWVYGVVRNFSGRYGFVRIIGENPFDEAEAFLHINVCDKAKPSRCVPEAYDRVQILAVSTDEGLSAKKLKFGPEVTAAVEKIIAEHLASKTNESGAVVDEGEQPEASVAVDIAPEAPTKPKRATGKKARKGTAEAEVEKTTAAAPKKGRGKTGGRVAGVPVDSDLPDGPMAAQLAALGLLGSEPNGATTH